MRTLGSLPSPVVHTWTPPEPKRLPELRQAMEEHQRTRFGLLNMAESLRRGSSSLYPYLPGAPDPHSAAALVLCGQESQRLRDARLYFADGDMTGLAVAAGRTAPTEEITTDRLPSPSGLMVFADPIGSYDRKAGGPDAPEHLCEMSVPTPIVGVSWSLWSPDQVLGGAARWFANSVHGRRLIAPGRQGIWLTFYTAGRIYDTLDPDALLPLDEHSAVRAGDIAEFYRRQPELMWDNETVLLKGDRFPDSSTPLGTTGAWAQIVYTAWQLMAQEGKHAWTEKEVVHRDRAGRKRDRREGLSEGDVNVVRLLPRHRPSPDAVQKDQQASEPRRAPSTAFRWEVAPYRSPNRCLNTRAHPDGCAHAERIIAGHHNGPKGMPVRPAKGPVHVWGKIPNPR
ncbi:hypothetical protein [Streptomyces sp. NBC_00582]|uniref:hypothetical protein n=1 Tax=Streptomyces sp. NBC_00582 TaxID=2975783 RepID=UPI002E810810|nr:hypothetical protein [Streptomyces sp. NBC_00582]WUB68536.1 hypothetical protein OG852_50455 [Streptomyces sp. NBC_00582]